MPKPSRARAASYAVGYGRPPLETRFRPGQSGNPRGRPRKRPPEDPALASLDPLLAASLRVMSEPVPVSIGGRVRNVSGEEAVMRAVLDRALLGDNRSTRVLLDLRAQAQARLEQVRARSAGEDHATIEAVKLAVNLMRTARHRGVDPAELLGALEAAAPKAEPRTARDEDPGDRSLEGHVPTSDPVPDRCLDGGTARRRAAAHSRVTEVAGQDEGLSKPAPRPGRGTPSTWGGRRAAVVRPSEPLTGPGYGLGGKAREAPACGVFD